MFPSPLRFLTECFLKEGLETVAKDVAKYLTAVPARVRAVPEDLCRTIRAAAPVAEERISYGMPGYRYHGPLIFFAYF